MSEDGDLERQLRDLRGPDVPPALIAHIARHVPLLPQDRSDDAVPASALVADEGAARHRRRAYCALAVAAVMAVSVAIGATETLLTMSTQDKAQQGTEISVMGPDDSAPARSSPRVTFTVPAAIAPHARAKSGQASIPGRHSEPVSSAPIELAQTATPAGDPAASSHGTSDGATATQKPAPSLLMGPPDDEGRDGDDLSGAEGAPAGQAHGLGYDSGPH